MGETKTQIAKKECIIIGVLKVNARKITVTQRLIKRATSTTIARKVSTRFALIITVAIHSKTPLVAIQIVIQRSTKTARNLSSRSIVIQIIQTVTNT